MADSHATLVRPEKDRHPSSCESRDAQPIAGRRRGRSHRLVAALFACVLAAAACSSSDSADGGDGEQNGSAPAPTTAPDSGNGDSTPTTPSDQSEQDIAEQRESGEATGEDTREEQTGPVSGGTLVYGIEADSANPWTHYATSCAISCRMILRAITDALFVADTDGDLVPYLVDSVEHNEDYTQWTLTLRDGIAFHDGTPFDGAAVAYNVNLCRLSPLTGPAFFGLSDVSADGQTVTFTYDAPDAIGPQVLRAEICGYMLSPTWMATLPNNPLYTSAASPLPDEQKEAALAAADGDPAAPVGLGAFRFVSYTPGNGNSFVTERNPDYWRGPNGITGESLPYLDGIEFVVAVDIQGRSNGLKSGQFDIIHTANANEISKYEDDDAFTLLQANAYGETSYTLLNVAAGSNPTLAFVRGLDDLPMDPGGLNVGKPMTFLSCRKALAHAQDLERFAQERHLGLVVPANGPFPPNSIGYLEDSGYPQYDPEAAAAAFEQCKADTGQNPVQIAYNTTNDPFNVESNELLASMWRDVFGDEIEVSIQPIEQGQYINLALAGIFETQGWRNHAGIDPSEQWYWWSSATSSPINPAVPELALNFGRFQDPEMDAAMATIRQNPDPAARKAAAEAVNQAFGKNVWNLWTYWTLWGIVASSRVQNLTELSIPDNAEATTPIVAGKHHMTQIWCSGGNCQG